MDLTKYIQQFEVGKFHYRLLIMIGLGWHWANFFYYGKTG